MSDNKELTIRFFKLKSGEEFISLVDSISKTPSGNIYNCLEPAVIAVNPSEPNQLAFQTWCMFSNERLLEINENDLFFKPKTVNEEILNEYKRFFFEGIEPEEPEEQKTSLIMTPDISPKMVKSILNG